MGPVVIFQELRVIISLSLVRAWLEGDMPSFQRPRWRDPERSMPSYGQPSSLQARILLPAAYVGFEMPGGLG